MAGYDGNGVFSFTYNWVNDAANGIPITASRMDGQFNDAVGGFDLCVTRDGQGKMAANFLPATTIAYDLGSASFNWRNAYLSSVSVVGITSASLLGLFRSFDNATSSLCTWQRSDALVSSSIVHDTSGFMWLGTTTAHPFDIYASNTMVFRAATDGSGLFGTTTPGGWSSNAKVAIQGGTSCLSIYQAAAGNNGIVDRVDSDTSSYMDFRFGTIQRGSIAPISGGGGVVYNTTSDYRTKNIFGPLSNSGSIIDAIPVYEAEYKTGGGKRAMFLAHEVAEGGVPWAVTGEKDAVDSDGDIISQQLASSDPLVPILWAEIKSLRARMAAAGIP